jgi:hypothetical protein
MGNAASEDTPTGRDPATSPDELAGRSVDREVAGTMEALRELAAVADRGGADAREDQKALARLERRAGDLLHETARDREALVARVAALEAREAQTSVGLEAVRDEVRRGRFRLLHLGALVCAAAIFGAGAVAGGAAMTAAALAASSIVTLVAKDVTRRR